ncbi:MAG: hypothetical protein D6820_10950, partial [Lentisphaerae bacterium]
MAAVIGAALIVHRQWNQHENLPYPTAQFFESLLPDDNGEVRLFQERSFWIASGVICSIHLFNYLAVCFPRYLPQIPLFFDFKPLGRAFRVFHQTPYWRIFDLRIYFSVIGFSYFMRRDVCFSLGIAPVVYYLVCGSLILAGLPVNFGYLSMALESKSEPFLFAGAWIAMFLAILYYGRYYYLRSLREACFPFGHMRSDGSTILGWRLFIVGEAGMIFLLTRIGVDWLVALAYAFLALVIFVVLSRLVAEAGVLYIHPWFFPGVILWGFFGSAALGVKHILVLLLITTMFLINPREVLMPFASVGFKLADDRGIDLKRTVSWAAIVLILAIAVSIPVT